MTNYPAWRVGLGLSAVEERYQQKVVLGVIVKWHKE